ncbi:hypothetical protein PENSUB_6113 [Penicillium subrubescens]|uniref:Uncharacterized protein n=1 Tax=Penicillium subrubescens TaxID=1316194 RepID=A0A1Q5U3U3_9EURO|nr:hypothetical protein PENSUB_6113 [Penicillium subrubescens]
MSSPKLELPPRYAPFFTFHKKSEGLLARCMVDATLLLARNLLEISVTAKTNCPTKPVLYFGQLATDQVY